MTHVQASEPFHQKPGILVRFVEDAFLLTTLFRDENLSGTHHSLPGGSQKVPQPAPEKAKSMNLRRASGARREEARLKDQKREELSFVLGGARMKGRSRMTPLPPPRPAPVAKSSTAAAGYRLKKVSLFLTASRTKRVGRPSKIRGAVHTAVKPPFTPVVTLEFLKHDKPDGETIDPDEPIPEESIVEQEEYIELKGEEEEDGKDEELEELDPADLHEQDRVEGMDELDEIEEFDDEHGKSVELEDLGEIVEDLEEFERSERKKLALGHAPLSVPSDDPYGAAQSGYMVHLGNKRRKKHERKRLHKLKVSTKNRTKTPKSESTKPTPKPQEPPQIVEPIIPLEPPVLILPPEQLKAIRVGYYDARSEKVLSLFSIIMLACTYLLIGITPYK